jgi:hypothetical protein
MDFGVTGFGTADAFKGTRREWMSVVIPAPRGEGESERRLVSSNNILSGMALLMATVVFAMNRVKNYLGTRSR